MTIQTNQEISQFFAAQNQDRLAFVYVITWQERMGRKWPHYAQAFTTWEGRQAFYETLCSKGNNVRDVHLESALLEA